MLSPAAGDAGDSAATFSGGIALDPGLPTQAGKAVVTAASPTAAISAALTNTIVASFQGQSAGYDPDATTVSTSPAAQLPFVVTTTSTPGQYRLLLEDLANMPGLPPDWDYNDRSWIVTVTELTAITASPPAPAEESADGSRPAVVTLTRSNSTPGSLDQPLYLPYTLSGTATPGIDYVLPSANIAVFWPGESVTRIVLPIKPDADPEGPETITVTVTPPEGVDPTMPVVVDIPIYDPGTSPPVPPTVAVPPVVVPPVPVPPVSVPPVVSPGPVPPVPVPPVTVPPVPVTWPYPWPGTVPPVVLPPVSVPPVSVPPVVSPGPVPPVPVPPDPVPPVPVPPVPVPPTVPVPPVSVPPVPVPPVSVPPVVSPGPVPPVPVPPLVVPPVPVPWPWPVPPVPVPPVPVPPVPVPPVVSPGPVPPVPVPPVPVPPVPMPPVPVPPPTPSPTLPEVWVSGSLDGEERPDGLRPVAFELSRTNPDPNQTAPALTVTFTLSGTATVGADYTTPSTYTAVFATGALTTTLVLGLMLDNLNEVTESVDLTITPSSAITILTDQHTGTSRIYDGGTVTAVPDSAATTNLTPAVIPVLANDEGQGASVTVVSAGGASHGSVQVNINGSVTYTPASGYVGTDTFAYTISDTNGRTSSTTVTVAVSDPYQPAKISGLVWLDANEDGATNGTEGGIAGAMVKLYTDGDFQVVATTTADSSGNYEFSTSSLTTGQYRIQFVDNTGGGGFTTPRGDGWTDGIFITQGSTIQFNGGQRPAAAKATPFTTILRARLEASPKDGGWDLGLLKDGKITEDEVDKLMSQTGNKEVTGDEAAALAQLKGSFPALKRLVSEWGLKKGVNIDTIKEYERLHALTFPYAAADEKQALLVKAVEKDFARRKINLATTLTEAKVVVNGAPGPAVGGWVRYEISDGNQDVNKVQQGAAGDCAFLSTTIGMVNSRGQGDQKRSVTIEKNVDKTKSKSDDDYMVTFQGYEKSLGIKKPTQSEISLYANAQDNGLWLSIMEKAYIQLRKQNYEDFFGGFFSKDAYKVLNGQTLVAAMKNFTNRDPAAYLTGKSFTAAEVEKQLKAVMVTPDVNGFGSLRVIVTAGTPEDKNWKDDPATLIPGHAYAVIGYNTKTTELTIVNPWNDSNRTFGTTFKRKLADFAKEFGDMCVESRRGVNRDGP
jgi:hypothetical protein